MTKVVRALSLVALLTGTATFPVRAEVPKVTVRLDRTKVALGDRVIATFEAPLPKGASLVVDTLVTPSPSGDAPAGGHVLEYEPPPAPKVEEGRFSQEIALAPFASGEVSVPGPYFVYVSPSGQKKTFRGPGAALTVSSRLPGDKKPDELAPRADRATRIPSLPAWFWTLVAGLAILVVGLVAWLVARRKSKPAAEKAKEPELAPDQELLVELKRLEAGVDALGSDARPFYSALTHAVKRYLERRLSLPILEWTTFETVRKLRDQDLEPPREIGLHELLGAADRVKFGRGAVTRAEAKEHVGRARQLKDHLEARLDATLLRGAPTPPPAPPARSSLTSARKSEKAS